MITVEFILPSNKFLFLSSAHARLISMNVLGSLLVFRKQIKGNKNY